MKKINNDLKFLNQVIDERDNYLWLFPVPMKTLANHFNDMIIAVEVKLDSA